MNTTILAIIVIVVAVGTSGIVSAISFSTPAHAGAQHFGVTVGNCVLKGVITPSANLNDHSHCRDTTPPPPAHTGAQHTGPQFFGSCVVRGVLTPSDHVIFHTHCGQNR